MKKRALQLPARFLQVWSRHPRAESEGVPVSSGGGEGVGKEGKNCSKNERD